MGEPESIGIRELRQNASRYVAMAKAGQRVAVTERGKLGASLVPGEEPRSVYQRMVAAGQVRPARGSLRDLLRELAPLSSEPGEKTLSETLREMRDEERY